MTERYWFLQANPKYYDIDAALTELDRIWWRVPQHTSEIHVGDVVLMWRSGKDSGIVGLGRVIEEPQIRDFPAEEERFVRSPEEGLEGITRALILVKPVTFIPKNQVEVLPPLQAHLIVKAPMGTVFPVSEDQWQALQPLLPSAPDPLGAVSETALPPAWGWEKRTKGVLPMPGGYSGYLDSLAQICDIVDEERPAPTELAARLEVQMHLAATAAKLRESFLRKVGFVEQIGGICRTGLWAQRWHASGDPRLAIALLHARCRFIGEMLAEAQTPKTMDELRQIANQRYGLVWDTPTQVVNRRGWLQSAGMLEPTDDGRLQTTSAGVALLHELTLFPGVTEVPPAEPASPPPPPVLHEPQIGLVDELQESAIDSSNPDRFERAVRDAFALLGFQAEWIGGSGKTDVLVNAPLGVDFSYRSIIDCKTSASGSVGESQVDFLTLKKHKGKHDADYILLVAPQPSGKTLFERAKEFGVSVLSAERLAALCIQHTKAPLGLEDYRGLFAPTAEAESFQVDERAEELLRLIDLAANTCTVMRQQCLAFGRLTAHDLLLLMTSEPGEVSTTEEELQAILDALASPLLGIIEGERQPGYLIVMSPEVARHRLAVVGGHLVTQPNDE